jgi:ATPase subunit of ABC transporter with duplicated ATPase domains
LNDGLIAFGGVVLFNTRDREFAASVANRVIEFVPGGVIDRVCSFDDYIADEQVKNLRTAAYKALVGE